jgi:hypothetical protein
LGLLINSDHFSQKYGKPLGPPRLLWEAAGAIKTTTGSQARLIKAATAFQAVTHVC